MQISQQELERRLGSSNNLANQLGTNVSHLTFRPSNAAGVKRLPENKVEEMQIRHAFGESTRALAKEFDVSQRAVSKQTTGDKPIKSDVCSKIKDMALMKTMLALGLIDDEKLSDLDARGLSHVALNTSKIVSAIEGNAQASNNQNVNVLVYSPQVREEAHYTQIEVST